MAILLLHLEAPMMAFGGTVVDVRHPTARFPGLSTVVGLAANAAGLRRTHADRLQALQDAIRIASRIDRPGELITDYQTAGGRDGATFSCKDETWSRHGIEKRTGGNFQTVQTWREYWADACVTMAVETSQDVAEWLEGALTYPMRPLFIGRKSCLPAAPIFAGRSEVTGLLQSLREAPLAEGVDGTRPLEVEVPFGVDGVEGARHETAKDVKDWANGVVTGKRRVTRGFLTLTPSQA